MKYDVCEVNARFLASLSGAQQGVTTCQGLEANYKFFSILHLFSFCSNWQGSPRNCLLALNFFVVWFLSIPPPPPPPPRSPCASRASDTGLYRRKFIKT